MGIRAFIEVLDSGTEVQPIARLRSEGEMSGAILFVEAPIAQIAFSEAAPCEIDPVAKLAYRYSGPIGAITSGRSPHTAIPSAE